MSKKDHVVEKVDDEKAVEAVIADSAGEATSAVNSDTDEEAVQKVKKVKKVKKSKLPWFLVLLLVALIGGLQFTGQLQPLSLSLQAWLTEQFSEVSVEPLKQSSTQGLASRSTPTSAAVMRTPEQQGTPHQAVKINASSPALVSKAPVMPVELVAVNTPTPTVTSEEVGALMAVIKQLRMEMQQLESSQQSLQDGLLEQQQMNRHVRLRWIADPVSRLVQIQLAWEEISLLPGLTDQQRQQAVNMHALARANVQRLQQWLGALSKWADALATPLHVNVLPKPEQAWLAWIVDQFKLRQAPSQEAKGLADLRSRLLELARQLHLEAWPNQAAWQRLHAELLLQLEAMQDGDGRADEMIDTGLPADFESIQIDIRTLRQTAMQWLHDDSAQGAAL